MRRKIAAEAAFQIALFLVIVTIGCAIGLVLTSIGVPGSRLIAMAIITVLIVTVLFKWERFFSLFQSKLSK